MRYLVDAVERSAHLVCVSSRYATLCAKAKRQVLLNPIKQLLYEQPFWSQSTQTLWWWN
jgi:hypothetical protein